MPLCPSESPLFYTEYTLNNVNEDLVALLPGNKILSRSPGEFIFHNSNVLHPTPLMNAIIAAVKEHVHDLEKY